MLGNFALSSAEFFFKINFLEKKKFRIPSVSNSFDSDHDLDLHCLQRLSENNIDRERDKTRGQNVQN